MNIIFTAQLLPGANYKILNSSDVLARCQKPESIFIQTCVDCFYRENMTSFLNYVTATLMMRLILFLKDFFNQIWILISPVMLQSKQIQNLL